MIRSEIQGSEGRIRTFTSRLLGERCYISLSDTKWHDGDRFKRMPIWFSYGDGYPSLYIWKLAIFYDNTKPAH